MGINGGAPLILYSNPSSRNNWLGLRLISTGANPSAAGAVIKWSVNGQVYSRLKTAGGSFLSSHDPREILGLGQGGKADWLEIRWPKPSMRVDRLLDPPFNKYLNIVEGKGIL